MSPTTVRIAVLRAWQDNGQLRIRVVFEDPSGAGHAAFGSADEVLLAVRTWLDELAAAPAPSPHPEGDDPVTP